jgi:hypothetical protein
MFSFIPNRVVAELEFRIFHNIFCDVYKIQRQAFAFDEYVDKVYEKFVMTTVEIRPIDWIGVSALFTLNFIRLISNVNIGHKCEHHDYHCKDDGLSRIFLIGGKPS